MKILQVTAFFKPSWEAGGVPRSSYNTAKALSKLGHDVTVFTTDGHRKRLDVKKNQPINVDNITVYYFKNLSISLSSNMFLTPYYLPFIAKDKIGSFDIIHFQGHRTTLELLVHYYARKYDVPWIIQPRGALSKNIGNQIAKNIYDKITGNKIRQGASKIFALNKTEAKRIEGAGIDKNKIKIIPNGVSNEEISNIPSKGKFRETHNINTDDNIILYLGRIDETKGLDLLLKSFKRLQKKKENYKLVLVGPDSGFLEYIKIFIKENDLQNNVLLTGPLYGQKKWEAYVDSDIFVTPKFYGFPLTFPEACASGTPIITTSKGDKLGWLDMEIGLEVEYNHEDLSKAIIELMNNEELYELLRNNCKKYARNKFSWIQIAKELTKIYHNCI